jgi:predicted methyltransferase
MTRTLFAAAAALCLAACAPTTGATVAEPEAAPPASAAPAPPAAPTGITLAPIVAALGAPDRPAGASDRDESRHTAEVMTFAGVKPGERVLDLGALDGYSTWVLSGVVGPDGSVVAQNPQEWWDGYPPTKAGIDALTAARPNVASAVEPFDQLAGDPDSFDLVYAGLIYHDTAYMNVDRGLMNRRILQLLKPGGRYVIVDHHAAAGSGVRDVESLHRIDAARVRREVENAGFVLDAESDVLTRPEDPLTQSVFDEAIQGRTSQFVYRFVKPAG